MIFIAILAAVGWLAYAAYDDLAVRQREIAASQGMVLKSINKLRSDMEREIKELKNQLSEAVRTTSADEIKLLRSVESSIRRLEEKMKTLKH